MYSIDLNNDMGESFGAYKLGGDEEIIKYVTTANVACGWHAGDPMVMDKVVRMAKERGVMVGAHPGYPDLLGFGRRKMVLSHDEVKNYVRYQIGALAAFTKSYGMKLQHVAPHGAMGNACQYDEDISTAICEAICEYDKDLIVYYCAGAVLGDIAESKGFRTIGIDGTMMFRYNSKDTFQALYVYLSEYHSGKRVSHKRVLELSYEDVKSAKNGLIVITPDFDNFTAKLIAADEYSKYMTETPILEGVANREYCGRSVTSIENKSTIEYGTEQGLAALIYGEQGVSSLPIQENT